MKVVTLQLISLATFNKAMKFEMLQKAGHTLKKQGQGN
jgi:hypothetical protein